MIAIIHIIVCMVIYIGIRAGCLKTDRGLLPVVFLVPFWGALGALMMHLEVVRGDSGSDAGRLEVMRRGQEEETEPLLNREEEEVVVPLEEALIINPPSVRRGPTSCPPKRFCATAPRSPTARAPRLRASPTASCSDGC